MSTLFLHIQEKTWVQSVGKGSVHSVQVWIGIRGYSKFFQSQAVMILPVCDVTSLGHKGNNTQDSWAQAAWSRGIGAHKGQQVGGWLIGGSLCSMPTCWSWRSCTPWATAPPWWCSLLLSASSVLYGKNMLPVFHPPANFGSYLLRSERGRCGWAGLSPLHIKLTCGKT